MVAFHFVDLFALRLLLIFCEQALTTATKPLIRQIDTLQHALSAQRLSEERSEKMYNEKLGRPFFILLAFSRKFTCFVFSCS